MRTFIYLVRHGESPYDEGDERTRGLTPKGKADIEQVTKRLIEEGIDQVVSSPYARAVLSVQGLAEQLNVEIAVYEDLRERHFSSEMLDDAALISGIARSYDEPDYTMPGGESNANCQKRAIAVLETLLHSYNGMKVAVGTHGVVMTLMMNHFDPVYDLAFLNQLKKPDIYKLEFTDRELKAVTRLWCGEV